MEEARKDIHKFLRTKHILDAGGSGVTRDDLLMTKREGDSFLRENQPIVVEEKVDGANLGISIGEDFKIKIQNRSHYVNSSTHKQFSTLDSWVERHSQDLYTILSPPEKYVLFGEWLFAKHSVPYTRLPDYFLAFDIFDVDKKQYLNVKERNEKLADTSISCVRQICERENMTKKELLELLNTKSDFYDGPVEGLVLRSVLKKQTVGEGHFFTDRTKLVRADFMQQIDEQWTRKKFVKNRLSQY